jgi:hypothetical protein
VRKTDILILLTLVAGVSALVASRQNRPNKNPGPTSQRVSSEIKCGPFRLRGLVIGMSKGDVESICGTEHSTKRGLHYETWDWTRDSETLQSLTFYDGKLLKISTQRSILIKDRYAFDTGEKDEILKALGEPKEKTAKQFVYSDLPGELVFGLQYQQVVSVTLTGSITPTKTIVVDVFPQIAEEK